MKDQSDLSLSRIFSMACQQHAVRLDYLVGLTNPIPFRIHAANGGKGGEKEDLIPSSSKFCVCPSERGRMCYPSSSSLLSFAQLTKKLSEVGRE